MELLHDDPAIGRAHRELHEMITDLVSAAAEAGEVRDDVPPDELADYCINALGRSTQPKAAVQRLVRVTLDGLRPHG
jgi:hypothetical protein